MKRSNQFNLEMLMDSPFTKKEVNFININDRSPMGVTLEYCKVINKIINYYMGNPIDTIKNEVKKIDLIEVRFSKKFMEPNFLEDFKEKSFFGKVSTVISSLSYEVNILNMNSQIELFEKCFHLEDSNEKVINDFLKNHPEYKRAKDEFDRLENEKIRKINQINSFVTALDKFRQYILHEFNPIILKFLDLIQEDEKKIKTQYIEISEKLNEKIDYIFKSTSSKVIIKPKVLLKWNELKDNIEILENDNNTLDKEIDEIVRNEFFINYKNENLEYFHSIKIKLNLLIEKKISKILKLQEDKELENLRKELKSLELKVQKSIEEKTKYLNNIEEFNSQYYIHLGELTATILNIKKEIFYKKTIKNEKLKEQYKSNKSIWDETKDNIDELRNTIVELEEILENIDKDNENYKEIKSAYDEIKKELENLEKQLLIQEQKLEKTREKIEKDELFQEEYEEAKLTYEEFCNEYEHSKDTAKVKKISLSLGNATTFKTVINNIDNKELLQSKIKEFEQNIIDLQEEIETIKDDDTHATISKLENWDEYFKELRTELQKEKDILEDEARRVLEEKEEIEEEHLFEENIQKEDSEYSKYILSIENVKFEKIRKYCENLLNDNQADEMQEYLAQNGRMYKALIYDSLEQFIEKLDDKNITLIDWGCKQGIASMLVLDYIKEKQLNINVDIVVLIDDDEESLSRAMIQSESLDFGKGQIIPIYINDNNYLDKIKTIQNGNTLNLYANDKIVIDFLDIDFDLFENAYFMCVSNENKKFVDEVYEPIKIFIDIQNMSIRDSKIGKYEKFERIFKISKEFDIEIDEIPF